MRTLIIDPGYSSFKWAVVQNGRIREIRREPTVISEIPEWLPRIDFGVSEGDNPEWKGKRYSVGLPALGGLKVPVDRQTLFELALPLFLKHAGIEEGDHVVVLISLSDWDRVPVVNEVFRELGVEGRVIPQGVGIWIEAGAPRDAVVIDIGFNTVDVIPFRNGRVQKDAAFAMHGMGLVSFLTRIRKDDPNLLCERLEGGDGELRELIGKHYWQWVSRQIVSRPEWQAIREGKFVLGGGGAYFISREAGIRVKNPEVANVRGVARSIINQNKEEGR